jgi:hypothetical protein
MEMKYLPVLFIVLATAFVSCKKVGQAPLPGKWQQTKLVIHQDNGNVVLWDTTYLTPFTSFDYMQFNDNGTCAMSSDFYLIDAPGGVGYTKNVQTITPGTLNFNYAANGAVYVLTPNPNLVNFAGITVADTVSIKGNTLLLHAVDYDFDHTVRSVFDSYFTKQQ